MWQVGIFLLLIGHLFVSLNVRLARIPIVRNCILNLIVRLKRITFSYAGHITIKSLVWVLDWGDWLVYDVSRLTNPFKGFNSSRVVRFVIWLRPKMNLFTALKLLSSTLLQLFCNSSSKCNKICTKSWTKNVSWGFHVLPTFTHRYTNTRC